MYKPYLAKKQISLGGKQHGSFKQKQHRGGQEVGTGMASIKYITKRLHIRIFQLKHGVSLIGD